MKEETERVYRERILRVLLHIQEHLDEPLPLEELAEIAYFSPFHFHRVFRGMIGESLMEHIRRLRLERAVQRLRTTDRNIIEIALEAGYETHETFTRAFRKMFGENPSVFRRNHRSDQLKASPSGVHFRSDRAFRTFNPLTKGGFKMDVRIEEVKPMRVAFVRHIGPYEKCEKAWGELCAWAGPKGLLGPKSTFIGICYDDPEVTPAEKIRYDACVNVGTDIEGEGPVGIQTIEGGQYAIFTHRGPLTNLIKTYQQIFGEWAPSSGRVIKTGPSFEVYLNDPHRTPPEEITVDIYVPLES